jgi:hypothetical protein
MNRYSSLRIKPFGFSIGARYGADSTRSFGSREWCEKGVADGIDGNLLVL